METFDVVKANRPDDSGTGVLATGGYSPLLLIVDLATCGVAVGILFLHCVLTSPRKLFWTDEVLTEVAVRGASLSGVLSSLKDTINAMPPSYFVGLWIWCKAFGTSEIALRGFSCAALGCAWIFCWLILRRFCSRLTAAVAVSTTMFCCRDVMFYNVDARCYTLYMAAFFAAGYLLVLCFARPNRAGAAIVAATIFAHALLVTTHYIGCIYSASLIAAAAVASLQTHSRALRDYCVAATIGAASLATCLPFLLAQRDFGGENNSLKAAGLSTLMRTYECDLQKVHIMVLAIAFCGFLCVVIRRYGQPVRNVEQLLLHRYRDTSNAAPASVLGVSALCIAAMLVPLAIWLESLVGVRLFLHRYMLPTFIVWPCILGIAIEQLAMTARRCRRRVGGKLGALAVLSARLCCALLVAIALLELNWNRDNYDTRVPLFEEIAAISTADGVDFASTDLNVDLGTMHYGASTKFVHVAGSDQLKVGNVIAAALERRYWPDFVVPSDELAGGKGTWLVLRKEWNDWLRTGVVSGQWHVVKEIGKDLVIVEK